MYIYLSIYLCKQQMDVSMVIYERGCLRAGEEWVERNLIPVAAVAVSVSVLKVCQLAARKYVPCLVA